MRFADQESTLIFYTPKNRSWCEPGFRYISHGDGLGVLRKDSYSTISGENARYR